ncbi:hypothetical protein SLS55_003722 [Diplodia seriata]|uniref:Uncharacterized protein n=1 Tax=Diplodia seriata TaxID=420778 RepID=A0ABR3CRF9_9PEZI
MGLRVGGKGIKPTNRDKREKRSSGALEAADDGGGLAEEEQAVPESEPPDIPALKLQPYVESVADDFEPESQTDLEPQLPSEEPPSDYVAPSAEPQDKKPHLPRLQTQVQFDVESRSSCGSSECGSDCDCDLETTEKDDLSEVDVDQTAHSETAVGEQGLDQDDETAPQGKMSVEPYRFPFQGGGGPEDQQSFYSGADKAPSPKASSYRGHGRVDSHASPIVDDLRYNPSIRAEVVRERRLSRDELRNPTLRSQKEPPPPEQPQYHGFEELDCPNDQEPLFAPARRKLSDEPVSPTSQPGKMDMPKTSTCTSPTSHGVADVDFGSSHDATVSDTEPSKSDALSDAESELSGSVHAVPQRSQRRTRPVSMSEMQERVGHDSSNTVRSAEWMRGGPPSSFYPHPDEPAGPAGPDSRSASDSLQSCHGSASVGNLFQGYSIAKQSPARRGRASYSAVPSSGEIEQRVAKAKADNRQDELPTRGPDQLDEERRRQKREKEIFAGRIAELEYEKNRLAMEKGEISLKSEELEKTVANMSTRFVEQRRRLTELELRQRGWEDFQAQLKSDAHGLLTPPDTASSRSTPGNPDRVIAWTETLSDSPVVATETPAAPEALQQHEAMHDIDASGRTLDETVINALHDLSDPTTTASFSDCSASQTHDSQPDMSVECATQTQALPPARKMPGTRLRTLKPTTPIYAQSNYSAATFGSEQQPCNRPEPELNGEQTRSNAHACQRPSPPTKVAQQTSQSSLRYHNARPRQQPKQVQFDPSQDEKMQRPSNLKHSAPNRSQDIVERLVKQQQKPVGRQVQHPAHRNQKLAQQPSNLRLARYANVPPVNNDQTATKPQHQAYNINSRQYHQQPQPGYCESQVIPAQQWQMPTQRQHSAPANVPSIQHHQSPLRHAYSSSQLQPFAHPPTAGGLVSHAHNAPVPEPLRKTSQQTLQPPRPSTSHGASRSAYQPPRPSTSHGRPQPTRNVYPPRPGTSHGTAAATFGGSTIAPLLPTIPQHFHLQQTQPQPQLLQHQHQPRAVVGSGSGTAASAYHHHHHVPFAPPPHAHHHVYGRGTSARSNDTANSHSTALSRMQHKARAGLAENERANAETRAEKQRQGNNPKSSTSSSSSSSPSMKQEPVVWGRDLVGDGVMAAREEAARLWREKELREEGRRREEEDRRIRVEMERLARGKMRDEVFA